MDWEPAEAPLATPIAAEAAGEAPDARVAAADAAGGAAAHTPACTADVARVAGRLSDSGGTVTAINLMTANAFLTPPAATVLKSSLKRRQAPASAPPGVATEDACASFKRARGVRELGARSAPGKSVRFRRTAVTLGRAEAVDRTPHDMPNTCDVCGEYCLRGRWSCTQCSTGEEYDICVACYATASLLAASLWPHPHGRSLFALADTAAEEEEGDEEADSATRAAAEVDGFFAAGNSPRQLASAFGRAQRVSQGPASYDCVLAISAAVDALQATDERP